MDRIVPLFLLVAAFTGGLRAESPYGAAEVGGFTVRWLPDCFAGAAAGDVADFQQKLRAQIDQINRVLPTEKVARLRRVPVYVHTGQYKPFGCAHHPSRTWLVQHGYPAEMANSIEVGDWREFRTLVLTQPACLLHEYAHAWEFNVPAMTQLIKPAFEHARKAGLYQSVAYVGQPSPRPAYALENEKEYFAELTETYFGRNDFFPFVRAELKTYDPTGYAMIERVWGAKAP